MAHLPLYTTAQASATAPHKERVSNCRNCSLGTATSASITRTDSLPIGGLYVIGPALKSGQRADRFLASAGGMLVRSHLSKVYDGPITYANATGCAFSPTADETEVPQDCIAACSDYIRSEIRRIQPEKVLLLGADALVSYAGVKRTHELSIRRGYVFVDGIPGLCTVSCEWAATNTIARKAFIADLNWALKVDVSTLPRQDGDYFPVQTQADLVYARQQLDSCQGQVSFDTETTGRMHTENFRVVCIAYTLHQTGETFVIPEGMFHSSLCAGLLRTLFGRPLGGFNIKYDIHAIACDPRVSGTLPTPMTATMADDARLARKLMAPDASGALASCAILVGQFGHKDEAKRVIEDVCNELRKLQQSRELTPSGKVRKKPELKYVVPEPPAAVLDEIKAGYAPEKYAYAYVPKDILWRYCARDSRTTYMLIEYFKQKLDKPRRRVYEEVTMPACRATVHMESAGMQIDTARLFLLKQTLEGNISRVLDEIHFIAPGLNPASPAQVSAFLASNQIKGTKKRHAKLTTDRASLKEIQDKHPLIPLLLQHRKLTKLHGTYAKGLLSATADDGRIHASFLLDGADTGRLSCTEPNLMNIPRAKDSPEGKEIRDCFVARDGWTLVAADYEQLEIRVAAWFSGDPKMIEILNSGEDFHMRTAKMISRVAWGISPEKVTDIHRQQAKTTNFAILYDIPDQVGNLVAQRLNTTPEEGQKIADAIFGEFSVLRAWMSTARSSAVNDGGTWTFLDGEKARFRPLWGLGIAESDRLSRGARLNAIRSTWNGPVQGTAADLATRSLMPILTRIEAESIQAQLVVTIHDDITLEVMDEHVEKAAVILQEVMTSYNLGRVPLAVEVKTGKSWGTMTKWKHP